MGIISTIEARKILGNKSGKYADSQLEAIVNSFVAISDLAIDDYLQKRQEGRNNSGVAAISFAIDDFYRRVIAVQLEDAYSVI